MALKELESIIKRLRAKDGCPWDQEQTHESLKGCMLEEAYEVVEAVNNHDDDNLVEELGDVLLQVVMHAAIAEEEDRFSMDDIIDGISEKMIRRHPHVFGNENAKSADEALRNWEEIKSGEKGNPSLLEELQKIPKALPANIRAEKIQKKAAQAGFEFEKTEDVIRKVYEELSELENTIKVGEESQNLDKFGDVMFQVINLSRFLGLNAENTLTNATETFINRLGSVERLVNQRGLKLSEQTPEQLDLLWEEVKNHRHI